MTHDDLATLLRQDVSSHEPHWLPDVSVPVATGRRRVRRRRAASALVAAGALTVAAAVAAPLLGGSDGHDRVLDPAAQALAAYDAQQMPVTLEQHSRAVLERSVPALGPATFRASDGQGEALTPELYDKASGMSVRFGTDDHYYSVSLDHAKSEAEGSARKYCESGLADGYDLECTVATDTRGNVVISRLFAARPMHVVGDQQTYMAVTADELDTVNPDRLFFFRGVKVIKSESLVTYAEEVIRARDLETAQAGFAVPPADWADLGSDPALVIPEPPTDDSGCGPWTLDPGVSYSC
jgi:hypothetical protein